MYYIGIDGGGSTTDLFLVNNKGELLNKQILPASNYLVNGFEETKRILNNGVISAIREVGIEFSDIKSMFIAIAGYGDIKSDEERLNIEVKELFNGIDVKIGNDTMNALEGSLAGESGINIIAGTGSIGLGRDDNYNYFRSGGWHHIFGGDEGSGYWLATNLLRHFSRQSDKREEKTFLYDYLKEKYNWKDDSQMLDMILNNFNEDRSKIAGLAPDVSYCASFGDEICIQILKDAARELADIIIAIYNKLEFKSTVKVSYSGGVFKSGKYILEPLKENLKCYDIELVEPILSPGAGAVILAMKNYQDNLPIEKLKLI